MRGWPSVLLTTAVLAGCQVYDFEPITPLALSQTTQSDPIVARAVKPDLMLLVDKSGSMDLPVDPSLPDCTLGNGSLCGVKGDPLSGPCNTTLCPTRWSELQLAMANFLGGTDGSLRLGLTLFPGGPNCTAGTPADIALPPATEEDPTVLIQKASDIALAISAIRSSGPPGTPLTGGGTPTGASLRNLGTHPPLLDAEREDFVVLLTDGLPNCNSDNPNNYDDDPATCRCTLASAPLCMATPVEGCLDQAATVAATQSLRENGIRTIVVGFGGEAGTGDGPIVLDAVARAGGFGRACPGGTDAECGAADTCDLATRACQRAYYQAATANDLLDTLLEIQARIQVGDPCRRLLATEPSDPTFLIVKVDGQSYPTGDDTWRYDNGYVQFLGALCTELQAATPADPANVEYRILRLL